MKIITTFFTATFLLLSANIRAAEITSSSAEYKDNRFIIKVVGVVDATPKKVFALLTDYDNLTQLSPKIIESKILEKDGDETTVKTVAKGCVWFFCKEITNTQITTSIANKNIQSLTIPEKSNLKFGKMTWEINKIKAGTEIEYYAEIEPDFFVPPLIGAYFIKNSMLEEAKAFIDSVENLTKNNSII
jgi:hypothetical protein